jgi:hypothetical protein
MPDELEARVDAVKRFVAATQGEAAADAKVATLRTVDDLRRAEQEVPAALPSLLRNTVKVPASPPLAAAAPPPPPDQTCVSEEQYNRMSARERLDYARQFPQEQFTNGGRRR